MGEQAATDSWVQRRERQGDSVLGEQTDRDDVTETSLELVLLLVTLDSNLALPSRALLLFLFTRLAEQISLWPPLAPACRNC